MLSGDRPAAIAALRTSVRHRPNCERRSRAITLARLAELQLADGQLERACDTWHQFLDDYPYLSSRPADAALAALRSCVRPFAANPVAGVLLHRAAT
ncbi:hypothetical protein MOQ72_00160 [Saccharopolyspora sp. K220]|uniref:tetratricopeptide repeat protein n=1 Tax=Saccharopolyspora soli TaxID=2926618 RepID=UPI001F583D23|nr:hypothetical protein [Saccharopolyspora soli]MCI2415822.1 hypothetical protein [Saccharopolyspora soli]